MTLLTQNLKGGLVPFRFASGTFPQRVGFARPLLSRWAITPHCLIDFQISFYLDFMSLMPNKSPEPTADSAGSSASRAARFGRLWLSFIR
jgi:hypothetical protein